MKAKQIIFTAAILGALAVILGAFGAHKLKEILEPEKLETFKLGVNYQYFHVLTLLCCGLFSLISKDAIKLFYFFCLWVSLLIIPQSCCQFRIGHQNHWSNHSNWWTFFYCRLDFVRFGSFEA